MPDDVKSWPGLDSARLSRYGSNEMRGNILIGAALVLGVTLVWAQESPLDLAPELGTVITNQPATPPAVYQPQPTQITVPKPRPVTVEQPLTPNQIARAAALAATTNPVTEVRQPVIGLPPQGHDIISSQLRARPVAPPPVPAEPTIWDEPVTNTVPATPPSGAPANQPPPAPARPRNPLLDGIEYRW